MRKMAKIYLIFLFTGILFFNFASAVLSSSDDFENFWQEIKIEPQEKEILLPDQPLYFLKTWLEDLSIFLTFNPTKKIEKILKIAEIKLTEIELLTKKNDEKSLDKVLKRYEKLLEKARKKSQKINLKEDRLDNSFLEITKNYFQQQDNLFSLRSKSVGLLKNRFNHLLNQNKDSLEKVVNSVLDKKEKAKRQWQILKEEFERRLKEDIEEVNNRQACLCSKVSLPVCGQDEKTYLNECFLRCAQVEKKHLGECQVSADSNF